MIHTWTEEKGRKVRKGSDADSDCQVSVKKEERKWGQDLSLSVLMGGKIRTM